MESRERPKRLEVEEYRQWLGHPTTLKVRQYLQDVRDASAQEWASGVEMTLREQAYAVAAGDILGLEQHQVEEFYDLKFPPVEGEEPEGEESAEEEKQ